MARTRSRVAAATFCERGASFNTMETVETEKPQARAMSSRVAWLDFRCATYYLPLPILAWKFRFILLWCVAHALLSFFRAAAASSTSLPRRRRQQNKVDKNRGIFLLDMRPTQSYNRVNSGLP